MLLAAGFAPVFRDRPWNDPALARARASVESLLRAHEPFPALTFDRHWNVLSANQAVWSLLGTVDPGLLKPPVNILRISLHPDGLAPQIVNITEWRGHLLDRLRRQLRIMPDPTLHELIKELTGYHSDSARTLTGGLHHSPADEIAIPLRLNTPTGVLSFLSTVTVFGTPVEITLSEFTLEAFYPADSETSAALLSPGNSQPARADSHRRFDASAYPGAGFATKSLGFYVPKPTPSRSQGLEVSERKGKRNLMAGRQGLEPRYADPESAVLPLDDLPRIPTGV